MMEENEDMHPERADYDDARRQCTTVLLKMHHIEAKKYPHTVDAIIYLCVWLCDCLAAKKNTID